MRKRQRRERHRNSANPATILGSKCVLWLKADHYDVATGVSRLYDRAKGTAQDAVQATPGAQPAYYGISTAGFQYVSGDGGDDVMVSTLSSTIVAGSRPWLWAVVRMKTQAGAVFGLGYTADNHNVMYLVAGSTPPYLGLVSSDTSAGQGITGPAFDTNLHLHEAGFLASGTGRYVVDGVGYNGTHTGGTYRNFNRVTLGAFIEGSSSASSFCDAEFFEVVLADSLPNADQFRAMRDYFARRYALHVA